MTDKEHHDLVLMQDISIYQFLSQEPGAVGLFVLRKSNRKMKELLSIQKETIQIVPETQKEGQLKEEFTRIFSLLRKAKPGIKVRFGQLRINERLMKILPKRIRALLTPSMEACSIVCCYLLSW